MKIKVGRPINGITINRLEYLLNDDNELKLFDDEAAAKDFLLAAGIEENVLDEFSYVEVRVCQCGSCERIFDHADLNDDGSCPHCGSGNWVFGYIDEHESEEE